VEGMPRVAYGFVADSLHGHRSTHKGRRGQEVGNGLHVSRGHNAFPPPASNPVPVGVPRQAFFRAPPFVLMSKPPAKSYSCAAFWPDLKGRRMTRRFLPTDSWVRVALAPVLVFFAAAGDGNYLADFWHHLARGRAIVQSGGMVDHDLFTYTVAGRPFQDTNRLSPAPHSRLHH